MSVFQIEVTSLCMCVAISATVSLFCLFAPKVYIVVFQPHKNVRQGAGTTSLTVSSMAFKTTRSLCGESSSLMYPVQNGSALRQKFRDAANTAVRWGEGDRKADTAVNDFHDSMEDLSCADMPDHQGQLQDQHQQQQDVEGDSALSLQFMDQSPDFCRAGVASFAAGTTVHNAAGDPEPFASSGNTTEAGLGHSLIKTSGPDGSSADQDLFAALVPSGQAEPYGMGEHCGEAEERQAEPFDLAEQDYETDTDPYASLVLGPDREEPTANLLSMASDSLLGPHQSRSDSAGDKVSFSGEALLKQEPGTRVSDSNLNRRNGNSLYRFRETRFGSCDNKSTSLLSDL